MAPESYLNHIVRPSGVCVLCESSLVEQERHPSILTQDQASAPKKEKERSRQDFCEKCWENLEDHSYFSFWLAKRTRPQPNRRLVKAERNDILWRLFNALLTNPQTETETHLYILAHLLMKYRLLRWRSNETDESGMSWVVFANPKTTEEYRVREFALTDTSLTQALQEIETSLKQDTQPKWSEAVEL